MKITCFAITAALSLASLGAGCASREADEMARQRETDRALPTKGDSPASAEPEDALPSATEPAEANKPNYAYLQKLDPALFRASTGKVPIFVRMEAQLFRQAGDFEAFCQKNDARSRSVVRQDVLEILNKNSHVSWEAIEEKVASLIEGDQLSTVQRYWLVNGFTCRAEIAALKELAKESSVAYIYRIPKHQAPEHIGQTRLNSDRHGVYREILDELETEALASPFDPEEWKVGWNIEKIGALSAWKEEQATGRGVVIAINDGRPPDDPALYRAFWQNQGEKLDGTDTDGNGYVDDIFGYNWSENTPDVVGEEGSHAGICASVCVGRPMPEEKQVYGVAPEAKMMLLQSGAELLGCEYAIENGADIVSMSFTLGKLGQVHGLYRTAYEHMTAAGVLAVGGAGNYRKTASPGYQISTVKDIPCVLCVAGVHQDGTDVPYSSEGPSYWDVQFYRDYPKDAPLIKPDATAFPVGYPVRNSEPYILKHGGNSFSGPHGAGVAALMFSVNPELPAWKVKTLIEKTCTDIGEPGRDTKFGEGLINALEAVRAAKMSQQH